MRGWIKPQELKYTVTAEEASGNPMGILELGEPFMVIPGMGLCKPTRQAVPASTLPREGGGSLKQDGFPPPQAVLERLGCESTLLYLGRKALSNEGGRFVKGSWQHTAEFSASTFIDLENPIQSLKPSSDFTCFLHHQQSL